MILSDRDIKRLIECGELGIDPYDPEAVQPASYDVRLQDGFLVYEKPIGGVIDPRRKETIRTRLIEVGEEGFILKSGGFVMASIVETISMPNNLCGNLEGRSSIGRLALKIHTTAGFIDPGFKGQVTMEMHNENEFPILLIPGMGIGQIKFMMMSSPAERPYGTARNKYQGQKGVTPSRVWEEYT